MQILRLASSSHAAADQLEDWGTVGDPIGLPVCTLRGKKMAAHDAGGPDIGIWECSPGRYRRQILSAESMHILAGEAVFTPDGGTPVTLVAGDVVLFPAGTLGEWEIKVALRKMYVVFSPAAGLAPARHAAHAAPG